ncbi:MAG: type I methionyl aminopeptidase [Bacteroidota bacterium]
MIELKTKDDIKLIKQSSLLVGKTLAEVSKHIKPGVKTIDLDKIAEDYIRSHNAIPAFKGYNGFPATLCISINEQVVHGIPGDNVIKDGDVVSVDCGVIMNGWVGDSAYTFPVGNVKPEILKLLKITKESLYIGIEKAFSGKRTGDIGNAIQMYVEENGYSVVRELVGHGIGKRLHEKPEIANYGKKGHGVRLVDGMVICIEPMINFGKRNIIQEKDGWTIVTSDKKPSAHFEHQIAITDGKAEILSTFEFIEN